MMMMAGEGALSPSVCIYVFTASGVSRMKINQTPHKRIIILHIIIIIIIRSYDRDGGIRASARRP